MQQYNNIDATHFDARAVGNVSSEIKYASSIVYAD